ncbi:hypothetical protein [Pseudomonas arsenicoxydans]|uniref:Terminase n=1 Tax=Pseudomonas arsenicoxydans TaxID=702115 RepID=A0A502HR68_9PSED|nr:hypothetical protein [Pseudomonas arsenicoxydans]TPG76325.1 hypothetical protein EAH78_18350 [Pseudomonas arsenicoxydans]
MSKKKYIDWERIELDYRAGLFTLREIAAQHDVTHGAINKRAKRDGWTRDLAERIRSKADELVSKELVSSLVSNKFDNSDLDTNTSGVGGAGITSHPSDDSVSNLVSKEMSLSVLDTIRVCAEAMVQVKLSHRSNITRYRALISSLLLELEQQTGSGELFEKLAELMEKPDDKGVDRLNDMYRKVIALPSRIDSAKKLSETLKILISLEREAFDIAAPVKVEHTGKGGGPIQHGGVDLTQLPDEVIEALMNARTSN